MADKRIALVLGAGSIKCAASIGLYRALLEAGVKPDMFVGCSAGALYGAAMALGDLPEGS